MNNFGDIEIRNPINKLEQGMFQMDIEIMHRSLGGGVNNCSNGKIILEISIIIWKDLIKKEFKTRIN